LRLGAADGGTSIARTETLEQIAEIEQPAGVEDLGDAVGERGKKRVRDQGDTVRRLSLPKCVFDAHVPLEQAPRLQGPAGPVPDSIVDRLETNVLTANSTPERKRAPARR
jgi:hypothetical protein